MHFHSGQRVTTVQEVHVEQVGSFRLKNILGEMCFHCKEEDDLSELEFGKQQGTEAPPTAEKALSSREAM